MTRRRIPARRRRDDLPPPASGRVETGADGHGYEVRPVPAARAAKIYRCPGCDHEIRHRIAHVVVWRIEDDNGEDRRHWHTPCWTNRSNRGPTRRWS